jgi:hypothetical protein
MSARQKHIRRASYRWAKPIIRQFDCQSKISLQDHVCEQPSIWSDRKMHGASRTPAHCTNRASCQSILPLLAFNNSANLGSRFASSWKSRRSPYFGRGLGMGGAMLPNKLVLGSGYSNAQEVNTFNFIKKVLQKMLERNFGNLNAQYGWSDSRLFQDQTDQSMCGASLLAKGAYSRPSLRKLISVRRRPSACYSQHPCKELQR